MNEFAGIVYCIAGLLMAFAAYKRKRSELIPIAVCFIAVGVTLLSLAGAHH